MKIEICEQLVQSWLQHIKQCEIVQTNWTVSPLREFTPNQIDQVKTLMTDIQDKLNSLLNPETINALQESADQESNEGYLIELDENVNQAKTKSKKTTKLNIFKKSTPSQFVKQCEIDVVGVKFENSKAEKIYLIDTAFHRSGLGYHDAVATVAKKIIRAVLVSAVVFDTNIPIDVIFAAPKCGNKLEGEIKLIVNALEKINKSFYPDITIRLHLNDTFTQEVYLPLKNNVDKLNNDNDLFMRAINLEKVAESFAVKSPTASKSVSQKSATVHSHSKCSKIKCTKEKALEIAAHYMKVKTTFPKMDEDFFEITTQHGAKTWNILRKYGVRNEHGGLLTDVDIDTAIANATDSKFKETLEEIKNRELY